MDTSPQMLQVYRDDEHASVAAPLLPISNDAQPRWSKQSRSKKPLVCAAFVTGALVATYLVLCTWVALSDNGSSLTQQGASTGFPHPRLPWPFPGRKHPHPHPHPHPHHRPHPIVLGCTAIPTPGADAVETSSAIELSVTFPAHAPVILAEPLIHGNVSVVKTAPSEEEVMMHEGGDKTLLVGIKVANRTFRHPPPPPPPSGDEGEEEESGPESFVLCAITFPGHPPPPPPPHRSLDVETDGQATLEHPHPPHPPHGHPPFHPHPPVIVAILPALNETYPKFPGPHGPPHHPHPPPPPPHGPPEGLEDEATTTTVASSDSVLTTAWKSTISFLFPMLSIFPSTPSTFPGHHGPPCHHGPHPPPPPPPPPPPFFVTALEVSLPRWTRVVYGHGPPPPPHGP